MYNAIVKSRASKDLAARLRYATVKGVDTLAKPGTSVHVLSAVDELPVLSIETREHVPADLGEILSWSLVPRVHVLPVIDDPEVLRI